MVINYVKPFTLLQWKFQQAFYTDRASEVLQHGIQTHALSVMYDIMNKTAQKLSNDSFLRLKT